MLLVGQEAAPTEEHAMRYEYNYITEDDLFVPQGTQQAPVLLELLNKRGQQGWKAFSFSGALEDAFIVMMIREVQDG